MAKMLGRPTPVQAGALNVSHECRSLLKYRRDSSSIYQSFLHSGSNYLRKLSTSARVRSNARRLSRYAVQTGVWVSALVVS